MSLNRFGQEGIPQLESYCLIPLQDLTIVQCIVKHDSSHIDNLMCDDVEYARSSNELHGCLNQDKRISSELFFECENCGGPLIQYAICRMCKKTDLRICLKCNTVKTFGDHRDCLRMFLLEMKKTSSMENKSA